MSSNTIYTTQIWDDSELEILYKFHNKESCSQISKKYLNKKSAKHISKKCKELNLDKYFNIWTPEEIQILKEKWETIHDNFILINIFPRWNIAAIDRKAYQLKLKKSDEVVLLQKNKAKNSLIIRNKTEIGRDMKYDFAKNEVLKYKSKQEMYKLDNSLYQFIHKNKLWDDLCGFMVIGNNFNYPQTFLYYCIKKLYENCEIIMNDRKAIYPKEIDVYIPSLKIGFEYDGVVYHSEQIDIDNDKIKDEICVSKNIKLYRIKEKSKAHPESVILESLSSFGYNVTNLNVGDLIKQTFSKQYTKEDIETIALKYTNRRDFRLNNPALYSFLSRKSLIEEYAPHLNLSPKITKKEILDYFSKFEFKNDILKNSYGKMMYSKFKKSFKNDADINFVYNKLKRKSVDLNIMSKSELISTILTYKTKREFIKNAKAHYAYIVYKEKYNDLDIIDLYEKLESKIPDTRRKNVKYFYSKDNFNWILLEIKEGLSLAKECILRGWKLGTIEKSLRIGTASNRGPNAGVYFKREYI